MIRRVSLTSSSTGEDLRGAGFDLAQRAAGDALYEDLRSFVASAKPHQGLAPERKLARQYKISVGTVRRAVQRLVDGYEVVWSDVAINTSP